MYTYIYIFIRDNNIILYSTAIYFNTIINHELKIISNINTNKVNNLKKGFFFIIIIIRNRSYNE